MTTTFALQNNWNRVEAMTARLARALRNSGRELFDFSVTDSIPDRLFEETSGTRFLYGSSQMVRMAHADSRLSGDLFFEPEQFDQRTWVVHRQRDLLNGAGENITWEELRSVTAKEQVFVRPTFDQKSFGGALVGPDSAREWFAAAEERCGRLTGDSEVWVSSPKAISAEYRFIVLDHGPVAASLYRQNDTLVVSADVPEAVWDAARELASGWMPARLVTMDVGLLKAGEFRIVEYNSIHSSGLYMPDLVKVIEAVERAYCRPERR